jgi:hypothetical protein
VIYTNDKILQLQLLERIVKWYYSKITPFKPIPNNKRATTTETIGLPSPLNTSFRNVETPVLRTKTATPQPKNSQSLLKNTYHAFVNEKKTDPEIENKLNSIYESMQQRQKKRINIGKYKESNQ